MKTNIARFITLKNSFYVFIIGAVILSVISLHPLIKQLNNLDKQLENIQEITSIKQWVRAKLLEYSSKLPSNQLKETFEEIYKHKTWTNEGFGSGPGSSISYTIPTRETLFATVTSFKFKSLLDLSCGGMLWMPIFLSNISNSIPGFKYMGLDVTESNIASHRKRFANMTNWSFEVSDMTSSPLPTDYDLVLLRDTIQHLTTSQILQSFRNVVNTPGLKYLLVTTVPATVKNHHDIKQGECRDVNLKLPPFNFINAIAEFKEAGDGKYLNLYDIQNYLKLLKF